MRSLMRNELFPCLWFLLSCMVTEIMGTFESNIPLVVIDTRGARIRDSPKVRADMIVIDNGGTNKLEEGSNTTFDGQIGIEIRGKFSSSFAKKQFGFETIDPMISDTMEDIDVPLLDLPKQSDWILNGPYLDIGCLRNWLSYKLSNDIGRYASRTVLVEAIIMEDNFSDDKFQWERLEALTANGQVPGSYYRGIYVLLEKIKRDKKRVNIAKNVEGQDPSTGGYIVKKDKVDSDGSDIFLDELTDFDPILVYPHKGSLRPQKKYISKVLKKFESALKKGDVGDLTDTIDVMSFIDHYLVNEFTKNIDAFRISAFLHKDAGKKLTAGPAWDFNLAMGKADWSGGLKTKDWYIDDHTAENQGNGGIPFWWPRLLEIDEYFCRVKERYSSLRGSVWSDAVIADAVSPVRSTLEEAFARDETRWDSRQRGEKRDMVDYLIKRGAWMDANIDTLNVNADCSNIVFTVKTIKFTEIKYSGSLEFIELSNQGSTSFDLAGAELRSGVDFLFPTSSVLDSGEYALVVNNLTLFHELYPKASPPVLGEFQKGLSSKGEELQLVDRFGAVMTSILMNDNPDWPPSEPTPEEGISCDFSIVWTGSEDDNQNDGGFWKYGNSVTPGSPDSEPLECPTFPDLNLNAVNPISENPVLVKWEMKKTADYCQFDIRFGLLTPPPHLHFQSEEEATFSNLTANTEYFVSITPQHITDTLSAGCPIIAFKTDCLSPPCGDTGITTGAPTVTVTVPASTIPPTTTATANPTTVPATGPVGTTGTTAGSSTVGPTDTATSATATSPTTITGSVLTDTTTTTTFPGSTDTSAPTTATVPGKTSFNPTPAPTTTPSVFEPPESGTTKNIIITISNILVMATVWALPL